jgi:hypothetical protein
VGAVDYDYIWDFATGEGDRLQFSTSVFANQAAVLAASSVSSGNSTITMGNGNFIVLVNADVTTFGSANFVFV